MQSFADLEQHLSALERANKLFRISEPIVKETELASLVRLQYRGLDDEKRRGFVFENVRDVKGRKYDMKSATGVYASSVQIYALGLQCDPTRQSIQAKWQEAQLHPVEPRLLSGGAAVQEVVIEGDDLLQDEKGAQSLPIPVELPGYSGSIRTTTPTITKDPETGIQNMGTYSAHVFGNTRLQWEINRGNHGWIHWNKYRKMGKKMPIAVVIGGPPSLFYTASAKLPYGVDELTVSGGLNGGPIDVVKCKTIDLQVPANAEIIIEGIVDTEYLELGNAYGEYNGFMAMEVWTRPPVRVTCITHRKNPTFVHVMSQFPPSESSKVRLISSENIYYKFLKNDCGFPVLDVAWHEMSQAQWCVIKVKKTNNAIPWQILNCASGYDARWGKYFIVVDEDIDPRDLDAVVWALSWRVQPAHDVRIITGRIPGLDLSGYKPDASQEEKTFPGGVGSSAMLIDATIKWPYPPISLPKKEYMERALSIWKKLGMPELTLKSPWFGYELGYWPKLNADEADLVVKGEQNKIIDRLEKGRVKAS